MRISAIIALHLTTFRSISSCFSSPNTGLTVSFWFRILKRSQSKFSTSSCQSVYTPLVHTTSHISSYRGFRVTLYGCRKDAIFVGARDYGRSITMMWGNAYNETLYSTWSHFAFTLHTSQGLAMYFNGEEVARKTVGLSIARFFLNRRPQIVSSA